MKKSVDALLKELSFILPDIGLKDLSVEALISFDVHNLEQQYANDSTLYAFFSILSKEAAHAVLLREDDLKDVEVTLEEEYRTTGLIEGGRQSQEKIRHAYYRDERYRTARTALREAQHKGALLSGLMDALNKKHTNLTMISARQKAELTSLR